MAGIIRFYPIQSSFTLKTSPLCLKNPEPKTSIKNPRSGGKTPSVGALIVCVCFGIQANKLFSIILRVEQLQHPTSPLHLQHRHPSSRYASPETFLGAAKPSSHWCWTILLIPAQLGNGSICGMRLWRRESNGKAHTSSLSPVLSTSWDNWIGPTE